MAVRAVGDQERWLDGSDCQGCQRVKGLSQALVPTVIPNFENHECQLD